MPFLNASVPNTQHSTRTRFRGQGHLRRDIPRTAETVEQKQIIKGTPRLRVKNVENLDEKRNERQRLNEAFRINQLLTTAYYLKEDLRQRWEQPGKRVVRQLRHRRSTRL